MAELWSEAWSGPAPTLDLGVPLLVGILVTAVLRVRARDGGLDRVLAGHVADEDRALAVDHARGLVQPVLVHVEKSDLGALLSEAHRRRLTDARRCARHQSHLLAHAIRVHAGPPQTHP